MKSVERREKAFDKIPKFEPKNARELRAMHKFIAKRVKNRINLMDDEELAEQSQLAVEHGTL